MSVDGVVTSRPATINFQVLLLSASSKHSKKKTQNHLNFEVVRFNDFPILQ